MGPAIRYKSTADYVTAEIQRLILSGELPAGARIDQIELASQLDVSRHPVRQAIERLAERGFIHLSPHRSAVVAELSVADMDELYDVRVKLESWAVRESWERLVEERVGEVEAAYGALKRADPGDDMDEYMEANRAFHLVMYQDCGNRHLLRMIVTLFNLSERYQRTALRYTSRLARSTQDHAQMVEAIRDRDQPTLLGLIERHNVGTQSTVREHVI